MNSPKSHFSRIPLPGRGQRLHPGDALDVTARLTVVNGTPRALRVVAIEWRPVYAEPLGEELPALSGEVVGPVA